MTNGESTKSLVSLRDYVDILDRENKADLEDLKENIKLRFDTADKMVGSALASADRAVSKAEMATEKRFESVNEFRNTLSDQQRTFMPRSEFEVTIKAINEKIDDLNTATIAKQSLGSGVTQGWAWAVAVVALIGSVTAIILSFAK